MSPLAEIDHAPDVNDATMSEHIKCLKVRHPRAYALLDKLNIRDGAELSARTTRLREVRGHSDFNDEERGTAYRAMQLAAPSSREYGDRAIFDQVARRLGGFNITQAGLDVIGGNGTMARIAANLLPVASSPYIIAGDPCLDMVNDALSRSLPAIWQSAHETLFADNSLDFVIGSRGFHHVSVDTRPAAFAEAWRILKPGGVALVIDFEESSPTARWYSEALDMYTNTGHRFAHFRRADFMRLLTGAGFADATVFNLYDPFRFWADSAEEARSTLLEHVVEMFGMVKLRRRANETGSEAYSRIEHALTPFCTFTADEIAFDAEALRTLSVFQEPDGRWRAEFPRVALCAVGVKS
jgi:ubiquinone/menaquinone biosynthesis C-methylase UbiE